MGVWSFRSPDSLLAGNPFRYERAVALRPQGPNADFHVRQYGFYAQDNITLRRGLSITAGPRVDIPHLDKPHSKPPLPASLLRINTGAVPSRDALWSPPPGVHYHLTGGGPTPLR